MTTEEVARENAVSRVGVPLVLASVLASTLGIVIAQFLDDLGDGLLAEILGGDAVLYNNRVEFTGASDVAWAGGFALCLLVGLFALFVYPTQKGQGVPRLVLLWMLLHVLRQALTAAAILPFSDDSQLAMAYDAFEMPPGLDWVIGAGGGVGLVLIALAAAAAFLAYTPHRRSVSTARKRFVFALWMALIPVVASVFVAVPFFLPDSGGLVLPGLPLAAAVFIPTVLAAPGTTSVVGPEDERTTPWPWGLAVFLLIVLIFSLAVLQGGVSVDPREWGVAQ